jgi:hypothetical protein
MPYDSYTEPGKYMLELIYSNIYSLFRYLGTGGELYWITNLDDYI